MAEPQRIAKLLARAGVASRREIERMIEDRRIAIDGVAIETPATIVRSLAGVTVDGKPVDEPDHARLFLYHKPTGVLTAANDPAGRKTIYDRMPAGLPRVVPVGRLDLNTEGLLLLTTDGGLKRQLELPATGLERTYRARCYGPVTQEQLESLSEGIEIEGIRYGSIDANIERRTGANVWIEMRLREGKNREVRRVLEFLGLEVNRLIRTAYGPFVLADLAIADVVEVLQHDLVAFLKDLKADPGARAARGTTMPRPAPAASGPTVEVRSRSVAPARAQGAARPAGSRVVASANPARPLRGGDRSSAAAGDRTRPAPRAAVSERAPGSRSPGPSDRTAALPARSAVRPNRTVQPEHSGREDAAPTPRPARPVKGKGWAKATKPTKRVGVGSGKRFPRPDRPMTEGREDFSADPVVRAPRSGEQGAPRGRAPRQDTARNPSADTSRPTKPPGGRPGPRPPRPGKGR